MAEICELWQIPMAGLLFEASTWGQAFHLTGPCCLCFYRLLLQLVGSEGFGRPTPPAMTVSPLFGKAYKVIRHYATVKHTPPNYSTDPAPLSRAQRGLTAVQQVRERRLAACIRGRRRTGGLEMLSPD
jgi:hypothetical protein